jgi:hypothetical protein
MVVVRMAGSSSSFGGRRGVVEGHTFVDGDGDEYECRLLSVRTGLDYRSLGVKVDRGDLPSLLRRRLPL